MFNRQKLKTIRKEKKITQDELAKAIGKSTVIVGYWEQGRRNPCESDIRMIATFLDISVTEISDLPAIKKLKSLQNPNLLDAKLKEIDYLIQEYGNLPADALYKIKELKDSFVENYSSFSRVRRNTLKYDLLLQNLPFIFYVKNNKLNYSYVNEAFLNLVGQNYNKEDIIGMSSLNLFGFNDYAPLLELEKDIFLKKEKISSHQIIIPGSRGKRIGLANIIPVLGDNNEVIEIMCSIRDITDSYEEQNRRKELESVTNKINHMIWIGEEVNGTEDSFKYIFLSDNISEVYGFEKHEALKDNKLWFKIVHKDYADIVRAWQLKDNYPRKIEYKINNPKKGERWVWAEVYKEGRNKFYGIVTDITEEKEKEREKEAALRTLNAATDAIKIAKFENNKKKYIYVNNANENLYEVKVENIKNDPNLWKNFIHPKDKEKLFSIAYDKKEGHFHLKYRMLLPNGKTKYIEENIFREIIDGVLYSGTIKRDVTKERKINQVILKAFTTILEETNLAIWIADYHLDKLVYNSQARLQLYEITEENVKKDNSFWEKYTHPGDFKPIKENSRKNFFDKHIQKFRLLMPDGRIKYIHEKIFSETIYGYTFHMGIQTELSASEY